MSTCALFSNYNNYYLIVRLCCARTSKKQTHSTPSSSHTEISYCVALWALTLKRPSHTILRLCFIAESCCIKVAVSTLDWQTKDPCSQNEKKTHGLWLGTMLWILCTRHIIVFVCTRITHNGAVCNVHIYWRIAALAIKQKMNGIKLNRSSG